jgi:hypothetical protein
MRPKDASPNFGASMLLGQASFSEFLMEILEKIASGRRRTVRNFRSPSDLRTRTQPKILHEVAIYEQVSLHLGGQLLGRTGARENRLVGEILPAIPWHR